MKGPENGLGVPNSFIVTIRTVLTERAKKTESSSLVIALTISGQAGVRETDPEGYSSELDMKSFLYKKHKYNNSFDLSSTL